MRTLAWFFVLASCNPSVDIGDPARLDAGASADAGAATGGGSASGGGSAMGGGSAGAGSSTSVVGGCPRVLLGSLPDVSFSADTASLPNLVISNRLEWREAPDDALEFTAPTTGSYKVTYTASNGNLGLSVSDLNGFFTRSACPPAGLVVSIDGYYVTDGMQLALTRGQSVVFFVSAPYWAMEKTGTYQLRIALQP